MQVSGLVAGALFVILAAAAAPVHAAPAPQSPPSSLSACAVAAPPCGYINPILDLDFPTKPKCSATAAQADLSKCIALPADNSTLRFAGTVRWYWKESEDLTYPPDTSNPIVISFSGVTSNPAWMTFKVDPPTYTITAADLLDPRNLKQEPKDATPIVYFWYERPINVTFTRSGSPDAEGTAQLAAKDGLLEVYVRAKSTASGTTFNAGFGGEYFRFDGTSLVNLVDPATTTHAAPGPGGLAAPAAALLGVTLWRRRRPQG